MKNKRQINVQQAYGPSIYQPNILTKQIQLGSLVGFKCTHVAFFICWFGLILAGTTIIGYGSMNINQSFDFCAQTQKFCFFDIKLQQNKDLLFYTKLSNFPQNNRFYLDAYSIDQLNGQNGTGAQCGNYKTYKSLGKTFTAGGYRMLPDRPAHPCGFPMLSIYNDQFHFASSDGAIPTQDPDILSNYSLNYRFNRLANYARTQWTDVRDHVFMNWFTVGMTSTKYVLLLKVNNLTAGDYRLIVKNNYPTNGQFTKKAFYTQANTFGVTNHLLGFAVFGYGIIVLLIHLGICCKSRD